MPSKNNTPNLRALKAVATLPIDVGPFVQSTTGAIVPFFNDSRKIYSHPNILRVFVEELAKIIRRYHRKRHIDLIVGVPMAGIPLAMALSLKTGIPFAYMNKERKVALRQKIVEGDYRRGARAILVDDVIGLGGTIAKAIRDCRSDGVLVRHVFTLFNPWWPKNRPFLQRLARRGITFDALYSREDWAHYLFAHGIVSRDVVEIQRAYLADLTGWHKDKTMWQKFLVLKRRYQKTEKL